jgi:hypothetical protein
LQLKKRSLQTPESPFQSGILNISPANRYLLCRTARIQNALVRAIKEYRTGFVGGGHSQGSTYRNSFSGSQIKINPRQKELAKSQPKDEVTLIAAEK